MGVGYMEPILMLMCIASYKLSLCIYFFILSCGSFMATVLIDTCKSTIVLQLVWRQWLQVIGEGRGTVRRGRRRWWCREGK